MYVRIARFEGGSAADIEAEGARILRDIEAVRRGETAESEMPSELTRLISRIEFSVDRERGASAVCVYCETEEQAREVDRIMNGMSPTSDRWGKRVSADVYEVKFDEATKLSRAA